MISIESPSSTKLLNSSKWRVEEDWRSYVVKKYATEKPKESSTPKYDRPFIEDLKTSISRCVRNSDLLLESSNKPKNNNFSKLSTTYSNFNFHEEIKANLSKTLNSAGMKFTMTNKKEEKEKYSGIIEKIKTTIETKPTSSIPVSDNRYSKIRRSLDERIKNSQVQPPTEPHLGWKRSNSLRKNSSAKAQERLKYIESKITDIRDKFTKAHFRETTPKNKLQTDFQSQTDKKILGTGIKLRFEESNYVSKSSHIDEELKEKVRQLKALSKKKMNMTEFEPKFEKVEKSQFSDFKLLSEQKLKNEIFKVEKKVLYYYNHILRVLFSENQKTTENSNYHSLVKEHFQLSFQVLSTAKHILNLPRVQDLKKIHLPEIKKPTLILDMDETLLHCATGIVEGADTVLDLTIPGSDPCKVSVFLRPFVYDALEKLSKDFEIVVFTASHAAYANLVLDFLDFKRKFIKHRIFRDYCVLANDGMFVKDLRIIVNRQIENILIVDNSAHCFAFQPENGVPIVPFYFDKSDKELLALTDYLLSLLVHSSASSLKEENAKRLSMHKYSKYASSVEFLESEFGNFIQNLQFENN